MQDHQMIYTLMEKIHVMKPATIDDENLKHLARLDQILASPEYGAEDKIDGCHYLMCSCLFFSKEHVEKTDNYPHLRDFFMNLNMPNLLLDGEINYPGKTSQYCTRVTGADPSTAVAFQKKNGNIHYTMYDILRTPKGTWLIKEPYSKRRKYLEYFYNNHVKGTAMEEFIHITQLVIDGKERFKDAILEAGGEGIVLKKLDSFYLMGKKPMWTWMKIKQKDEADLVVMGFDPPTREYSGSSFDSWPYWRDIDNVSIPVSKNYYFGWIGAIQLGAYVNGKLTPICSCSGMNEETRKHMSEYPNLYLNKVVRISFMEKTEAGYPRHPNFEDLHPDKEINECTWELEE